MYGIELASVEDVVETALADPVEASLLGVDTGLPILLVHRTARAGSGRPVEWTRSVFRCDRFRFVARSRLGDQQAADDQAAAGQNADNQTAAEAQAAERDDGAPLDVTGRRARARSGTVAR